MSQINLTKENLQIFLDNQVSYLNSKRQHQERAIQNSQVILAAQLESEIMGALDILDRFAQRFELSLWTKST